MILGTFYNTGVGASKTIDILYKLYIAGSSMNFTPLTYFFPTTKNICVALSILGLSIQILRFT